MKRLVLFVMAVMAFAGMSVAQDVYSSGYYKDGSNVYHAAVFKNGAKLWTWSGSSTSAHTSSDVDYYNGDVYWVDNAVSTSDGVFYYGDIVKNGSKYLENATGSGAHIYALERSNLGTALFAIGCKKTGGVKTAWFWNDNVHMDGSGAQLGDGIYESVAYGAADDGSYMCICGYQHTDASTYHGVIWRNGVFHSFDNGTKLYDMAYYNGYLYIVGSAVEGSSTKLKVWETKVSDGTTTVKYTISESMTTSYVDERFSIYMDAGDIYVNGMDSGTDKIWKNGNELYTGGSYFCSVVANTNGVYYAGQYGGGQIWKDGEILYSPTVSSTVNSDRITGLFIAEPTCTNNEARSLPFNETFENGETDWPCWTKIDADNNNGTAVSYWHRAGEGECTSWHGHYCVRHPTSTTAQEGWLISPRLILQPEYNATLTFRSWSNSGVNKSVLVSTGSNPSTTSSYTEVWSNDEYQPWSNVEIDLSAYQGQNIYIAFKYNDGNNTWLIDDVDVEETAPSEYTITANANNSDWGTVSGGGSYAAGATCVLHATPATGYQFECWKKNGSGTPESTNPDYSFAVTESATYTAYFAETPVVYYTISTGVLPSGAGSVEGGGTFAEGSSVTLTATAGEGYTFDQWQDGNTDNPRTVEVTGDATYTAHFTQEEYTVVVFANPTDGGTVGGGGPYHYGETATLTATPASGYEFAGWSDGSNENPHTVTVTGNAVYTATFNPVGSTFYTVSTSAEPEAGGTVTGGGPYEEGTEVQLRAIANPGYTFSHWNDGVTSNPRTITVTGDMTFKAIFTQNAYTITVNANPSAGGEVSGGGSYYYGTVVSLRATAYNGYEFAGWSDGSNENPHDITVTGNATYTATFSPVGTTFYTVSASVSPVGAGTVDGAGAYSAGTNITLTAEANEGYTFDHWNDGSTDNPRRVMVNNNMSFTAYFSVNKYTITVGAEPEAGGTVTGGGIYPYGQRVTLRAEANSGYNFLQWSDGNRTNPRTVVVTGDATYTAMFMAVGGTTYVLKVASAQPELGSTYGSGVYPAGTTVRIEAFPNSNATFVKWSDGNTDNPRMVVVNRDMSYTAEFAAAESYTIEVLSANPEMGSAFGGGTYVVGMHVQISAVANPGYIFTGWDDGNTENPRTITVTGDATYRATFSVNSVVTHTVTLICNTAEGSVMGGGVYVHGSQAYIQAMPNTGYVFTKWSDENTENPRVITVTGDVTLVAFFATGVEENGESSVMVYPNPAQESIRILGIEPNSEVEIYNSLGELVKVSTVSADEEIGIRELASGLYVVRCGHVTLRFVKTL